VYIVKVKYPTLKIHQWIRYPISELSVNKVHLHPESKEYDICSWYP